MSDIKEWIETHVAEARRIVALEHGFPSTDTLVIAHLATDRDRLAAELARVRRNHLRRMLIDLPEAQMRAWWYKQEGTRCGRDLFTSDRQDARWDRFEAALRAALAQPQDGTK